MFLRVATCNTIIGFYNTYLPVSFSVVDVVGVLTDQPDARHAAKYWSVLKVRLKEEGSELPTNCNQLKMRAVDGKMRLTDAATTERLFRIIQSIPSPKAEPFKLWLSRAGAERIEETIVRKNEGRERRINDHFKASIAGAFSIAFFRFAVCHNRRLC